MNEERKAWLQERKTYLGGSDISAILGLSTFKSALDIYLSKTTDAIEESYSQMWCMQKMRGDVSC